MLKTLPPAVRLVVKGWLGILVFYACGPAYFPFPEPELIVYLVLCFGVFLVGAKLAEGKTPFPQPPVSPAHGISDTSYRFLALFSWITAAGAWVGLKLLTATGRTFDTAINKTGVVRQIVVEDLGLTSALANMFGFLSFSCLFVCFLIEKTPKQRSVGRVALLGSAVGAVAILAFYIINVNRTAFLVLLAIPPSYMAIRHGEQARKVMRQLGLAVWLSIFALFAGALTYIIFIAVNRSAGAGENTEYVATYIPLKYRLGPLEDFDYNLANGIYKLVWYPTHQIDNLNRFLEEGVPLLDLHGELTFRWLVLQLSKAAPELNDLAAGADERAIETISRANVNPWEWFTGFGTLILDFGVLGSLLAVAILGFWIVRTYRGYIGGSLLSGVLCFWLVFMGLMLIINYPIDNFIHSNIYILSACRVVEILVRPSRSSIPSDATTPPTSV